MPDRRYTEEMDERVERALAQWPDVPDVYGWLSLDRRGRWRLRGQTISNRNLVDFINRNYLRLDSGGYAFQNGPQKVHVRLEATPWIAHLRRPLDTAPQLDDHTGQPLKGVHGAWLLDDGSLILETARGPALMLDDELPELLAWFRAANGTGLDDASLEQALNAPEDSGLQLELATGRIPVRALSTASMTLAQAFDFVSEPTRP